GRRLGQDHEAAAPAAAAPTTAAATAATGAAARATAVSGAGRLRRRILGVTRRVEPAVLGGLSLRRRRGLAARRILIADELRRIEPIRVKFHGRAGVAHE